MRLTEVIEDLPITCSSSENPSVSGITHDSRRVGAGDLFAALVGQRYDGRMFVPEAIERGAVGVLASDIPAPGFDKPWLVTENPRSVLGPLAARIYRHPDRELITIGVTGTNGKTTVSLLLATFLAEAGFPTGSLGTLGYNFGDRIFGGDRTTPEATDFFHLLRQMHDQGAKAVCAEISSHALAQDRVEGGSFDLAVFTNLTRDHFDYHRDFESYFDCKRCLFGQLKPEGRAVVNIDDPYGRRLADEIPGAITFGKAGDVRVGEAELDLQGIRCRLQTPRGELDLVSPLLGEYNLSNLLAAVAGAEALELPHAAVKTGAAGRLTLPGRMEVVDCGQAFPVVIDYAHTDAALEAALRSLKSFTGRKVILVFGCGGDRDPGKRALMGRVAGDLAELSIITSDNPRSEDPLAIIAEVEKGLQQSDDPSYRILPDRREAIRRAVAQAGPEWAVLIAGKGHEEVQIIGDEQLPFSDREEVERALEEHVGAGKSG
jgi:UDP-N-acetylmuramoyl-L-alanyl-D-glutamate--2,6-diaminopimelate ligase